MSARVFVDTDVVVYSLDAAEPHKQERARAWMEHLWRSRLGRLSWQVLHEIHVTVTEKLEPGLGAAQAREVVRSLMAWRPVPNDRRVVEAAWALQDAHRISWWDALVLGAAQVAACPVLLSEDLQDGAELGGVRVVSPFTTSPEALVEWRR